MRKLIEGFLNFRASALPEYARRFQWLAEVGQNPRAAVVACCDSRVDPQMIFSAGPGDLFIIRNVANLIPPYQPNSDFHGTSAALEFAVRQLRVGDIIVMGHTHCGGVKALMAEGEADGDFIGHWMSIAKSVRGKANDVADAEREVIRLTIANLLTFPWIKAAVEAGGLRLHGCLFDVADADLLLLNQATGEFKSVQQGIEGIPL
ncbi:carbonic anhydrase [Nitrospirillum sp. BR 11164]|uniref:carbonic anhydrase n=1 Tax=Nitrospirillum sp. BR 11164 TaxID=3104324 RepID=UPI002B0022AE|nr:carbonic anhydrase [Nitrospirillum sp. BR 11164]MEA1649158.1 carbonic anhydrase [Nitrospirillum sp. BR 11164]